MGDKNASEKMAKGMSEAGRDPLQPEDGKAGAKGGAGTSEKVAEGMSESGSKAGPNADPKAAGLAEEGATFKRQGPPSARIVEGMSEAGRDPDTSGKVGN